MNEAAESKPLIVTGLSGAGIATFLNILEDLKYEVFDNFPLHLATDLINSTRDDAQNYNGIVIGVDTRTRGFSPDAILETVKVLDARLLLLTCDDNVLQNRFTETRRRHPMGDGQSVSHGIAAEHVLFAPLYQKANLIIDTTDMSIHDLRHSVEKQFGVSAQDNLTVSLMSFGFKHGAPRNANIVMDVRFLKNPHWDEGLRMKTGLDADVGRHIRSDEDFDGFLSNLKNLISPLLPRYAQEGKAYLTIAIGCTGGRHRSVYVVETIGKWLGEQGVHTHVEHRDL